MAPRSWNLPGPGQPTEEAAVKKSSAPAPRGDTREVRALALYRERGAEIVRTGPWTYLVPSLSGGEPHAVNYKTERCDCADYGYRGILCAHVYVVGIHRAKRRGAASRASI
jgi:hypothetical protein